MITLSPLPITQSQAAEADDHTRLHELVHRELSSNRRGTLSHEFRELISPYLITDLLSDQFLHIHRGTSPSLPRTLLPRSISVTDFLEFLRHEGPVLRDEYLNFKSLGHTGCVIVAEHATNRLNRITPDCSRTESCGDYAHYYTRASVEGRDYWVDFTVDQFVAYGEVVERHRQYSTSRSTVPTPSYAGTLTLPIQQARPR